MAGSVINAKIAKEVHFVCMADKRADAKNVKAVVSANIIKYETIAKIVKEARSVNT